MSRPSRVPGFDPNHFQILDPGVAHSALTRNLSTYNCTSFQSITSLTMKISSLSFALIMALPGGFGAVLQPHNMTGANLEFYNVAKDDYDVPRGKCSVRRNVWSRTWWVTLTNVSNDPVNEICDRLWAGLARRKCFSPPDTLHP